MMIPLAAISLFCDDIREEKSGQETLIGIMPDNIALPELPFQFVRLAIYTRIHLAPEFNPGALSVVIRLPDSTEQAFHALDSSLVENARESIRISNAPMIGLISRTILGGFTIATTGRITAFVRTDVEEHVSGTLNIQLAPRG